MTDPSALLPRPLWAAILRHLPLKDFCALHLVHPDFQAIQEQLGLERTELTVVAGPGRVPRSLGSAHEAEQARRVLDFYGISGLDDDDECLVLQFQQSEGLISPGDKTGSFRSLRLPSQPPPRGEHDYPQVTFVRRKMLPIFFGWIGRLFPNLRSLTVVITAVWPWEAQRQLLTNWSDQLWTLRLINPVGPSVDFDWARLEPILRQFGQLRHLSVMNWDGPGPIRPLLEASSGCLEELLISISGHDQLKVLAGALQLGNLRELGICQLDLTRSMLTDPVLQPLYQRLTRLHGRLSAILTLATRELAYWARLTYLDVVFDPVPGEQLPQYVHKALFELSFLPALDELRFQMIPLAGSMLDRVGQQSLTSRGAPVKLFAPRRVRLSLGQDVHRLVESPGGFAQRNFPNARIRIWFPGELVRGRSGEIFCPECVRKVENGLEQFGELVEGFSWSLSGQHRALLEQSNQTDTRKAPELDYQLHLYD